MTTPTERAQDWFDTFDAALQRGDTAAGLFDAESYSRDLVAFTWNLKTAEGRDALQAMLDGTLSTTKPSNWKVDGEATEAGCITEAWFTFETGVARAKGLLRPNAAGRAWTLLTTMVELKGLEEARGANRPKGVEHGVQPGRMNWAEQRAQEAAELGDSKQPYAVIVGGGRSCTPSTSRCTRR